MKNPFKIEITREEKIKRRIIYSGLAVVLTGAFIVGYATVYKNCYNTMNSEPMEVFEIKKNDSGFSVVILNNRYDLY